MRQAFAGMLWSKQLYYFDVRRWLDGDPTQPRPPVARRSGRNARWRNFDAFDIMSMPDKWEYPWFAAWDLAFHCVALAHVDPAFAKYQLILLCREWFQHPNGALPAYEWDFGDVNPPVQAWAALEVFAIDGGRDLDFLSRVFDKLLVNFTWWVNLEDADGSNVFEGGFLGLDNIGPIDRSHLPVGGVLEQSDATGWMASYALAMAAIAGVLNRSGQRPATDLVLKFAEHFAAIREAMDTQGLWDDTDGLFYDRLVTSDGDGRCRSRCAPWSASSPCWRPPSSTRPCVAPEPGGRPSSSPACSGTRAWAIENQLAQAGLLQGEPGNRRLLLGVVGVDRLQRIFTTALRRAGVPLSLRPAGHLRLPPRPPLPARRRGPAGHDRLRAGRVDDTHVRRQLQLAGPVVVPAQLPGHRCSRALRPLLRRQLADRVPDRLGTEADPRPDRPGPAPAPDLHLPGRARRPPALLRRRRQAAARPGVEGQPGVQRVLPRRQRRRARGVPPDGLDRDRRGHHPASSRRRGFPRRRPAYRSPPWTRRRPPPPAGGGDDDCGRDDSPPRPPRPLPARAFPLGATPGDGGTNFAVASGVADGMWLCLFDEAGHETRIALDDYDAGVWHGFVPGVGPGPGLRLPHHRSLRPGPRGSLQPGQAAARPVRPGHRRAGPLRAGGPRLRRGRSRCRRATWTRPASSPAAWSWIPGSPGVTGPAPGIAYADTVIYEAHVKGFTMTHPDVPPELRGTYAGLGHQAALAHLVDLGITAVELLPVHQNVPESFLLGAGPHQLLGLQHHRLLRPPRRLLGRGPRRAARRAGRPSSRPWSTPCTAPGWRCILDVVFNHTAEADHLGPTLCFRGLDNPAYYHLVPGDPRHYVDTTGCGNTVNAGDPTALRLIMDSLRYWLVEMRVDGFRFDLAPSLAREEGGFDQVSAFFDWSPRIRWCRRPSSSPSRGMSGQSDSYALGRFPPLWREWNGKYRDTIRDFWRSHGGLLGEFADRFTGSADLFARPGRRPTASVNLVTVHDGFTLTDLVSYDQQAQRGQRRRQPGRHRRQPVLELRGRRADAPTPASPACGPANAGRC